VTITVADDGIGLPAEVAAAPFEPRRSRVRTAGAGLGLSIARGIVAAHGGLLELLRSQAGTSFEVRLPVEDNSVLPGAGVHGSGPDGSGPPAGPLGDGHGGHNAIGSLPRPARPRKEAGRS
jgi:hypothetical protein